MRLPVFPDKYDPVQRAVLKQFQLDIMGVHGLPHWSRVYRNGLLIAGADSSVDLEIVTLFAMLHDARRVSEFDDPAHGIEASRYTARLAEEGFLPYLSKERLTILRAAIADHPLGFNNPNSPTIQACWDADRLDLPRIGVMPDTRLLGSVYALTPGIVEQHWDEAWNSEGMDAMIEVV